MVLDDFLSKEYIDFKLEKIVFELSDWRGINEDRIFEKLTTAINMQLPVEIINVFLTTFHKHPYNPIKWFCLYCPITK